MSFEITVNLTGLKKLRGDKTHPCIVLYMAAGNPREMCDKAIGVAGFCIVSFLKHQSCNNGFYNFEMVGKVNSFTSLHFISVEQRVAVILKKHVVS